MKKSRKSSKAVRLSAANLLGFRLVEGEKAVAGMDATTTARIGGKVGKKGIRRNAPRD